MPLLPADAVCEQSAHHEETNSYTTHPLIKSYFESDFKEDDRILCHKRIYEYFGEYAPEEAETLEAMQPLFEQVYHGCGAGLYDEAFDDVYLEKIQKISEGVMTGFLVHELAKGYGNFC